jgi:hypothetical protein
VGWGRQPFCFWPKIPCWKRKCETVRCGDAMTSCFVTKVRGEVFAYFRAVAIKHYSSMINWMFCLSGRILCEQSPWCQRKWWACSWLCSSPVSPFSASVSVEFLCTAHAFFSANDCPIFTRVSAALFRDLHKISCTFVVPL